MPETRAQATRRLAADALRKAEEERETQTDAYWCGWLTQALRGLLDALAAE